MSDWGTWQKVLTITGSLLVIRLLRDPLIEFLSAIFDLFVRVLQRTLSYLQAAYSWLLNWTRTNITSRLSVGQAVGGLFAAAVFAGFAYANYRLLSYSLEIWLPEEQEFQILGLNTSNIMAIAFITLEVIGGFFIAELLDISKLIDVSRWSPHAKRVVMTVSLAVLGVLTIVECATAVGRQMAISGEGQSRWPALVMGLAGLILPLGTALVGALAQHVLLTFGAIVCGIILFVLRLLEIACQTLCGILRGIKQVVCALIVLLAWPFYLLIALVPRLNEKIDQLWKEQIVKMREAMAKPVLQEFEPNIPTSDKGEAGSDKVAAGSDEEQQR